MKKEEINFADFDTALNYYKQNHPKGDILDHLYFEELEDEFWESEEHYDIYRQIFEHKISGRFIAVLRCVSKDDGDYDIENDVYEVSDLKLIDE